ncbi:thiamine pyrophosphokinase 3-like isoform X3 [Triticum dicoccoides]|uniref:thiamine pyrophosphokinase 3-like isoform X3 n=1 Tax=Triticum dicoccoides TaxID=85692 RepID=UPI00188EA041|nr:thiamine pyrophosphokinase 3-like isoform X3 [Triticum dicoccoides]
MEPEPHHPRRAPTAAMDPPSPAGARPAMSHSSAFLLPSSATPAASADAYAVVVLNQRLPRFAPLLWDRAQVRVCADGGANRVFDGMPELLPGHARDDVRSRYKPDVIKGDMDSVRPEVKEYYSNLLCILVLGALGGRFDHEMGNINVLHLFPNIKIVLLSDDCLIFLLPRTHTHNIHIERSVEGPHCGLIPIGAPSTSTTTTGLRWNLDNTHMSFGGLISTSNTVDEDQVMVTSDSDLIWTISLRH